MHANKTKKQQDSNESRPLLRHSTILILSAFLVGIAAGKAPNAQVEVMLYLMSICGVISYFALGRLANKRRRIAEQQEQATQQLEMRVGRHIPQLSQISDNSALEGTVDERLERNVDRQRQPVGSAP